MTYSGSHQQHLPALVLYVLKREKCPEEENMLRSEVETKVVWFFLRSPLIERKRRGAASADLGSFWRPDRAHPCDSPSLPHPWLAERGVGVAGSRP